LDRENFSILRAPKEIFCDNDRQSQLMIWVYVRKFLIRLTIERSKYPRITTCRRKYFRNGCRRGRLSRRCGYHHVTKTVRFRTETKIWWKSRHVAKRSNWCWRIAETRIKVIPRGP
jgi:hypothetical protein